MAAAPHPATARCRAVVHGGRVAAGVAAVLLGSSTAPSATMAPAATARAAVAPAAVAPAAMVPADATTANALPRYVAPVAGRLRVVRGFVAPVTPYGPGHRGVDLALGRGGAVLAAGPGVIGFAGRVAGRGVVVVAHPDGITTEYEPVLPLLRRGTPVAAGEVIARLSGRHPGCRVSCVHWGARAGSVYLDPLTLLGGLGPVRLLPWPHGPP